MSEIVVIRENEIPSIAAVSSGMYVKAILSTGESRLILFQTLVNHINALTASNYVKLDGSSQLPFTPSSDYHVSTKKYVDDSIDALDTSLSLSISSLGTSYTNLLNLINNLTLEYAVLVNPNEVIINNTSIGEVSFANCTAKASNGLLPDTVTYGNLFLAEDINKIVEITIEGDIKAATPDTITFNYDGVLYDDTNLDTVAINVTTDYYTRFTATLVGQVTSDNVQLQAVVAGGADVTIKNVKIIVKTLKPE